jgi:hypothetical protein
LGTVAAVQNPIGDRRILVETRPSRLGAQTQNRSLRRPSLLPNSGRSFISLLEPSGRSAQLPGWPNGRIAASPLSITLTT